MAFRLVQLLAAATALCLLPAARPARAQQPPDTLRTGDTWIMVWDSIRALNARPVIFSPSPVNDGTSPEQWQRDPALRNAVLDRYASALVDLAHREQLPYSDQFHLLAPVWGRNTALWNAANGAEQATG